MLSWLIIVSSVFVIMLLFYTVKYIVTLLQLGPSELIKNNQLIVYSKESISRKFKATTQIIVKFKEDVREETQLDIHYKYKNECTILDHNKDLNFLVLNFYNN
ncbi:hypothetical protein D0441_27910 [Priestia megaterium]|nr:hypothetical protein D0441_27910 [Priestia megaterium]